jgi:Chaperonin GroEL (HSP60 family)
LSACQILLEKGIHPTIISEGFQIALDKGLSILEEMKKPIDLNDKEALRTCVVTSLASKVVSQNADILAPIAVDAVLKVLVFPNFPHF